MSGLMATLKPVLAPSTTPKRVGFDMESEGGGQFDNYFPVKEAGERHFFELSSYKLIPSAVGRHSQELFCRDELS